MSEACESTVRVRGIPNPLEIRRSGEPSHPRWREMRTVRVMLLLA